MGKIRGNGDIFSHHYLRRQAPREISWGRLLLALLMPEVQPWSLERLDWVVPHLFCVSNLHGFKIFRFTNFSLKLSNKKL